MQVTIKTQKIYKTENITFLFNLKKIQNKITNNSRKKIKLI